MESTHFNLTFDLIADATSLWSTRLEQPCASGFTSFPVMDQTVGAGP